MSDNFATNNIRANFRGKRDGVRNEPVEITLLMQLSLPAGAWRYEYDYRSLVRNWQYKRLGKECGRGNNPLLWKS